MRDTLDKWLNLHPSVQILAMFVMVGAGGTTAITAFSPFVLSADYQEDRQAATAQVQDIREQLDGLSDRMTALEAGQCASRNEAARVALDSKLRDLNSQVWSIERAIASGSAGPHDIVLLDSLKSQQRQAERAARALDGEHCARLPVASHP